MNAVAQPNGSNATAIRPFHVDNPEAELTEMRKRIMATRWPTNSYAVRDQNRTQGCEKSHDSLRDVHGFRGGRLVSTYTIV